MQDAQIRRRYAGCHGQCCETFRSRCVCGIQQRLFRAQRNVFEISKRKQFVLQDRTAGFRAVSVLVIARNALAAKYGFDLVQLAVVEIVVDSTVPSVRAIGQNRIELAAGVVSELRLLLPLHQREVHRGFVRNGRERAGRRLVIVVSSVDVIVVARVRTSSNGRARAVLKKVSGRHTFAQQRKVIGPKEVATLLDGVWLRKQFDLQVAERGFDVRRAPVFNVRFGSHLERPAGLLHNHDGARSSGIDIDLGPCIDGLPCRALQCVFAGLNTRNRKFAVLIGRPSLLFSIGHTNENNGRAGYCFALRVSNSSLDFSLTRLWRCKPNERKNQQCCPQNPKPLDHETSTSFVAES